MKYIVCNYENGSEHKVAETSSLEGARSIVENSLNFFKEGYVIYESKIIEYGT